MKLRKHAVNKGKNETLSVDGVWTDEFRQPASVSITIDRSGLSTTNQMVEGPVRDVNGVLFGLAQIAWNMGWRPAGFMERMTSAMMTHKVQDDTSR